MGIAENESMKSFLTKKDRKQVELKDEGSGRGSGDDPHHRHHHRQGK